MKVIGIIGGTTYHSTIDYYRIINEEVNKILGGDSTARIIINSVNFKVLTDYNQDNNWKGIESYISELAIGLEKAGADCILLGANTLHFIAPQIQEKINIPIIHIVEETVRPIKKAGIDKVGLLGTKITMKSPFYKEILERNQIQLITPKGKDLIKINNSIYEEFSKGIFTDEMKTYYLEVIDKLIKEGAEGIILGCTEIPILIKNNDVDIKLFDTAKIHIDAAIKFALGN